MKTKTVLVPVPYEVIGDKLTRTALLDSIVDGVKTYGRSLIATHGQMAERKKESVSFYTPLRLPTDLIEEVDKIAKKHRTTRPDILYSVIKLEFAYGL